VEVVGAPAIEVPFEQTAPDPAGTTTTTETIQNVELPVVAETEVAGEVLAEEAQPSAGTMTTTSTINSEAATDLPVVADSEAAKVGNSPLPEFLPADGDLVKEAPALPEGAGRTPLAPDPLPLKIADMPKSDFTALTAALDDGTTVTMCIQYPESYKGYRAYRQGQEVAVSLETAEHFLALGIATELD
jgi:hypothetical protein